MLKLLEILEKSKEYLEKKEVSSSKFMAELIIAEVLQMKRLELYLNYERPMQENEVERIREMVKRKGNGEPLQYINGYEYFYGLKFNVNKNVLIPRPDTEILVEECLSKIKKVDRPKILDIGTGSGAISVAIGKNREDSQILAADISKEAIETAKINSEENHVKNIKFVESDVFSNINYRKFDLIVSNPPYIPEYEYIELMREVKDFEPKLALTAEDDGYYFYKKIILSAWEYLNDSGILAFETGYNQAEKIKSIMEKSGKYSNIEIIKDYNKIDRVVTGIKNV